MFGATLHSPGANANPLASAALSHRLELSQPEGGRNWIGDGRRSSDRPAVYLAPLGLQIICLVSYPGRRSSPTRSLPWAELPRPRWGGGHRTLKGVLLRSGAKPANTPVVEQARSTEAAGAGLVHVGTVAKNRGRLPPRAPAKTRRKPILASVSATLRSILPVVNDTPACAPLPPALLSRRPSDWLAIFGPGAVLASLTIGVGELVFSSRAGALFGYRLLWLFVLALVMKWILVFGSARHIVLTGAHPFQRWMNLPGPRGWFPLTFFLIAIPCFPIWVCFHAGTLGTLLSAQFGTESALRGGSHLLWGVLMLVTVLFLSLRGGYTALERIQLVIVVLMLGSVLVATFFVHPDWIAFLQGLIPQTVAYPNWVSTQNLPDVVARPVWLEVTTYVGVIGGSSYDYLAYASYLRDKRWGRAGLAPVNIDEFPALDPRTAGELRLWLRAPLIDCTLSFVAVLLFTAVFVVGGAAVLGPQHQLPSGTNLLSLQAEFLAALHPWFRYVYFVGAFLAVFGTLYGTIEVAPTILREIAVAFGASRVADEGYARLRLWSILWTGLGGLAVLGWILVYHGQSGSDKAPGLIAILTPANLFTGVLGCGFICLLNCWMDRRFLPPDWRPSKTATFFSLASGAGFMGLGLIACWDHSGWMAFGILAGTMLCGWITAQRIARTTRQPAHQTTPR